MAIMGKEWAERAPSCCKSNLHIRAHVRSTIVNCKKTLTKYEEKCQTYEHSCKNASDLNAPVFLPKVNQTFIILALLRRKVQRLAGPISAAQPTQRWRAVGDTVFDLTGSGIEAQNLSNPRSRADSDVFHYAKWPD